MIGGRRQSDSVLALRRLVGERGGVRDRGEPGGLRMCWLKARYSSSDTVENAEKRVKQNHEKDGANLRLFREIHKKLERIVEVKLTREL